MSIPRGKIIGLMGPNGAGKSSLAHAIMGFGAKSRQLSGKILLDKKDITNLSPSERAILGVFLAFQTPVAVPGIKYSNFLRQAYKSIKGKQIEIDSFREILEQARKQLNIPEDHIYSEINTGLSGGEKKKMEVLQMLVLQPKYIILDEIDSGLDVDTLALICKILNKMADKGVGLLVITHYQRIFDYLSPQKIYFMQKGKIALTGGANLASKVEKLGYERVFAKK